MAMVGYARVSSLDQDHVTQVDRLKAAGCTKIFSEKKSGTHTEGRSALEDCLDWVREGDVLLVTKLDRFARSARDLHNLVHELSVKGVGFKALDQGFDTSSPEGKLMLSMLAAFAEFETNIRRERQLEGVARAKAEGVYKGRKPISEAKKEQVLALLGQGCTKQAIADETGLSVRSVYNICSAA